MSNARSSWKGQWCPFPQHLARWSTWTHEDPRWRVERIDTTSLSVADTMQTVRA